MCWRDTDRFYRPMDSIYDIQRHKRLTQAKAKVGDEAHTDEKREGGFYFRRKTSYFFGGTPADTVELLFNSRTKVLVTEIPAQVREKFCLGDGDQTATLRIEQSKIVFRFKARRRQKYIPLDSGDKVAFKVIE